MPETWEFSSYEPMVKGGIFKKVMAGNNFDA